MECKLITLPQNKKESLQLITNLGKALAVVFIKGLNTSIRTQESGTLNQEISWQLAVQSPRARSELDR